MAEGNDIKSMIATEIEFINILEGWLEDGNAISMASLEKTYLNIAHENGTEHQTVCREKLKQLLIDEIANVEFSKPNRANESEHVFSEGDQRCCCCRSRGTFQSK